MSVSSLCHAALARQDLLLTSNFFFTDGIEDSSQLFPDLVMKDSSLERERMDNRILFKSRHAATSDGLKSCLVDSDVLNIELAIEAACGDFNFLVTSAHFNNQS